MICYGIGHKRMRSYGNWLLQYIICIGPHKIEKHSCGIAGYNKGKRKIYVHIAIKCANYGENHTVNSPRCTSRYKVDIEARKKKKRREKGGKEKT